MFEDREWLVGDQTKPTITTDRVELREFWPGVVEPTVELILHITRHELLEIGRKTYEQVQRIHHVDVDPFYSRG